MLQKVVRSTVIDAPIERVWAVLRDFNSHDQWHTVVDESRIEGGERSDQVGCVRSFALKDGHRIREQLLTLDPQVALPRPTRRRSAQPRYVPRPNESVSAASQEAGDPPPSPW